MSTPPDYEDNFKRFMDNTLCFGDIDGDLIDFLFFSPPSTQIGARKRGTTASMSARPGNKTKKKQTKISTSRLIMMVRGVNVHSSSANE